MDLTILICTHNRAELLARTLASINAVPRPEDFAVEILVIANACSDATVALLRRYIDERDPGRQLPLRWAEVAQPGKSYALNHAITLIDTPFIALVDDDHRLDDDYLLNIRRAVHDHPQATLFCGRILPDWDGREPTWVHDTGPYRIYPLPIPRYDQGDEPLRIRHGGPVPGGGNLVLRRAVFERIGNFSTLLGPHGHDLGGGEDSDFVLRALAADEWIQYVPGIVQYHYVDPERLRLGYLLRKGYQRSRSVTRVRSGADSSIPRYMWRKLATYLAQALFSLSWPKSRFFLIRLAATLGEMRGYRDVTETTPERNP